jgi:hypothetical protein
MYRETMLKNESIFQISTLLYLISTPICNLFIDLPMYKINIDALMRETQ